MADDNDFEQPVDFRRIGAEFALGADAVGESLKKATIYERTAVNVVTWVVAWALKIASYAGAFLAERIAEAEDQNKDGFQRIAAVAIKDMFGVDVSGSLNTARGRGGNPEVANAIGGALMKAFSGQATGPAPAGEIQPSDEPAKNFLSAMAQLALEGWLEGWMVEALSLGQIETFGELDDAMGHVLGLGRASGAVHGPLVKHLIVTPLDWKLQKEHRPTQLSQGEALELHARGLYSDEDLNEELARQGLSNRRIELLKLLRAKSMPPDDVLVLVRAGLLNRSNALEAFQNQGMDVKTSELAVQALEHRRMDAITDNALGAVVRAFVNADIDEGAFTSLLPAIVPSPEERELHLLAARTQRELNIKRLSHAEVLELVQLEILPTAYYRDWLQREGYGTAEAMALEIRLRTMISADRKVAEHRADVERERAAAQKLKDDAAAARAADLERQHALARRGTLADLRRAAARGLIPVARVEEVLTALYDADTVAIYVALIEADRAAYLEEQARRADAVKRAAVRAIDVGALERAVLERVVAPADYRRRLEQLGFSPADADLLTATVSARLADLTDAQRKRDAAAAAAKVRSIDLGRAEQLVRRGVWTVARYDALLQSLGFDEASRAAMGELLQLHIADDAAAAKTRADAENALRAKGLSLEQLRRAVILGTASEDQFQAFLVRQGFTSDAQLLLLAELRDDVATAADARRRREEADARLGTRAISLTRLAGAARLGIVTPATYHARLEADGYSADDVAIEMSLLVTEIADVQAARAKRDTLAATIAAPAPTLADVARDVRAGVATLEDYRARAAALGYEPADATLLTGVLDQEIATLEDAQQRRAEIVPVFPGKNLALSQLEDAVRIGFKSIDSFIADLVALKYEPADAELLAGLLLAKIGRTP